jgi:anti-sigma factor RsiW
MTQITHEQARRLIHLHTDEALRETEKNILEAHLRSCTDCSKYSASIMEMEHILRPMLQQRWNHHPLPLPLDQLASKGKPKRSFDWALATRIAAMGVICIAVLFNIWQSNQTPGQGAGQTAVVVPPAPTPSQQSTSTFVMELSCEPIRYVVRENDTVESIAEKFSVDQEKILTDNKIQAENINSSMELMIPVCEATPSGTPITLTTMFTPMNGTTSSTPSGSPTQ